ncbi:hypothetical protein Nepgr_000098 [Nepenthes gracilis]|uniref:DUF3741 domain-containing protein n=1 Tax=Nepenthes gracilis TaxID=150966 RepID=A0AAD3P2K1_NEPGR|nr:hypothetical protein Nepgr_000098 [Nepenthes gracilis]
MGKHIYVRLEEDSDPGCVWGFLQILGYHQWRGIKGILQRRKRGKRKSNRSNAKLKQTKQNGAQQEFSEPEPNSISVKWGNPKTGSMSTKQVKSSIKALIAEEISKDDDSKCRVSGSPEQSPLKTVHAKPSFHGFQDRSAEWRGLALLLKNGMDISTPKLQDLHLLKAQETPVPSNEEPPLEKSGKSRGKLSNQMLANYGKHRRFLTQIGLKDNIDFLELLKVNKEPFLEILHDPDAALASELFSRSEDRQKTARLIKSGSFPSANSSHNRFSTPSKLEHKHTEIWPVVKGKKLLPTPEDNEDTNTNNGIRNFKLQSIRKSSSLTESMDKYAQLFSYNFDKETTRQLSRSLKLTNEKDFASADNYVPKSFRRRLSMPELEYSYSLHPKEASGDAFPSGMWINKEVSLGDMNGVSHDEAKALGFCVSMKEPLIPNSKDVRSQRFSPSN